MSSSSFISCPAPAPTCSGHGVLVNVTNSKSGDDLVLCSCDDFWGDGGDVFDGRIMQTSTGKWLTQDCRISSIGQYVIFAFMCFAATVRALQLIKAIRIIHSRQQAKSFTDMMHRMAYRVLFAELFIGTPNFYGVALCKLIGLQALGTDVAITVCLANTVLSYNLANADLNINEFKVIIRGALMNAKVIRHLILTHKIVVIGSAAFYFFIVLVPTYVLLGMDKGTGGPTCNGSWIILLIRNGGVVLWQVASLMGNIFLRRAIQATVDSVATTNQNSKAHEVILQLNEEISRMIKLSAFLSTLYIVWMFPWLWSSQCYLLGFGTSLGIFRHAGRHLIGTTTGNKHVHEQATITASSALPPKLQHTESQRMASDVLVPTGLPHQ